MQLTKSQILLNYAREVGQVSSVIAAGRIKKNKGSILQEDVYYEMRFMDRTIWRI